MDLEKQFLEALIPEPVVVLGVRLRPFSLGHSLFLQRQGNKFLASSPVQGTVKDFLDDLVTGVAICSSTWRENLKAFSTGSIVEDVARWNLNVEKQLEETKEQIDWERECQIFNDYIVTGTRTPPFTRDRRRPSLPGEPENKSSLPSVEIIRVALMAKLGMSHAEIMDLPLAQVMWDFLAYEELYGKSGLKITTEASEQIEHAQGVEMRNAADELYKRLMAERSRTK